MASNTPESTKSSYLNTLPTLTNINQTPSDVRRVTWIQDFGPLTNMPDSDPDHQNMLSWLCAAEQSEYTPQWQSSQASLTVTPDIPSPDCGSIQVNIAAD